ncbi:hypothetical protein SOW02_12055 [Pectobacterium actinidiae]|uniref:hypothetical protein n=1 Tax=Pectobacterium actinidiae TaxID=1507808 RepID=UPI002A820560|nr:hypothetical protein [Pectobacterium actinidiae]MDY4315663.1 hypothetical protein [Pectobacterium actinidiae]
MKLSVKKGRDRNVADMTIAALAMCIVLIQSSSIILKSIATGFLTWGICHSIRKLSEKEIN